MHRHDCNCIFCDQLFDLCFIYGSITEFHITEHRFQTVSHDRMCGRYKCKRCRDNFRALREIHCLNCHFKCHMSVYHKRYLRYIQIFSQFFRQFFMIFSHIGEPMAVPQRFDRFYVFFIRRHRRLSYIYFFILFIHYFSSKTSAFCISSGFPVCL